MATAVEGGWLDWLKGILDELERSQVAEFELVRDGTSIYLRRDIFPGRSPAAPRLIPRSVPSACLPQAAVSSNGYLSVCSPLTGVFYLASSPSAPPRVRVGDRVEVGQAVALVEAMKAFNEIRSEHRGRVAAILAQSGQLVQKGQVLMHLEEDK